MRLQLSQLVKVTERETVKQHTENVELPCGVIVASLVAVVAVVASSPGQMNKAQKLYN